MFICRLSADSAAVFLEESEAVDISDSLSLESRTLRRLLKDAAFSAFGSMPPKLAAEALPLQRGCVFFLRRLREGVCHLVLTFPNAAAAYEVIASVTARFKPHFCIIDGRVTLLLQLSCAQAERLVLETCEFCSARFVSSARAAYLRQWGAIPKAPRRRPCGRQP